MQNDFQIYLPAKNEEIDIKQTINDIKKITNDRIIVVDNDSSDDTHKIATKYADKVIVERSPGKGNVVKRIINDANCKFLFFTDGDNTYDVSKYEQHKKLMIENNLDMIVGKRIYEKKYIKKWERKFANKIFNFIFKILIGGSYHDICSGYRIIKLDKFKKMKIQSRKFEIETEINIFSILNNLKVKEYEINYRERINSKSKLKTIEDSSKILFFLFFKSLIHFPLRFLLFLCMNLLLILLIYNLLLSIF